MPELPEVEVVRQGLGPLVVGRRVEAVAWSGKELREPVDRDGLRRQLVGWRFTGVARRAKYLLLATDHGALLVIHLGMSGRLGLFAAAAPCHRHDHLRFLLDNGLEMRFNDARRFGSVQLFSAQALAACDPFAGLGPEPLGKTFTTAYLVARGAGRRLPVKSFLMDSRVVVGIGNIYASEILFAAAVHPLTPAGRLDRDQWQRVARAARTVLRRAIKAGGTTIADYVNAGGKPGYFQLQLAVYGRGGAPCRRCRRPIERTVLSGRATYFCPSCQQGLPHAPLS